MKNLFKYFGILFLSLLSISSCGKNEEDLGIKVESRTLNFYALNDFHGAYLYDEDYDQIGLSRIGNYLIEQKEKDPENTFIIASGDMFQGGAESNITYGKVVIEAMNTIGFDAMSIGNHEFDWDEDILKEMESQMNFPLLGINVFYEEENNNDISSLNRPSYLLPSTVIKKEGIKVGIIGSIMPNIDSSIIASVADKFYFADSLKLIEDEIDKLRTKENCDIVILSTHDGNYSYYEDISSSLDAIFLGHEHERIEGKYKESNVPYVEGQNYGSYLSHISLDLKLNKDNHYEVIDSRVNNIETFSNPLFNKENEEINKTYLVYKEEIEKIRDEVLFTFKEDISKSKFSRFVAYSLKEYATNISPRLAIDSAFINNGGIRDNISNGEFTYGDLIRIYPFENKLAILEFDDYRLYEAYIGSKSNVVRNETIVSVDNKFYCATIDYVALSAYGYSNMILLDDFARDIVASILKDEGFIEL